MTQAVICLVVFVLTLIAYMVNKWPLALVSMTSLIVLSITGCLTPAEALAGFANSSTIIMGSMFIVAAGLNRTQMIRKVSNLVYKVSGGSFTKGMAGYCLVALLIAQVAPSAILIFSICYPLVSDFCRKMKVSPSKGLFSIALIAIATVAALPIGSGATSHIARNAKMASYGLNYISGMFDACIIRLPVILVAVLCGIFVCPRLCPDNGELLSDVEMKGLKERKPLDPFREACGYGIFILVVLGILFSSYLPISIWQICALGAVLEIITGVLSEKEAMAGLTMPPLFLYVGALGLGTAMVNSGAGDLICSFITKVLGDNPSPVFVYVFIWLVSFIVTQFMSNTALNNALTPMIYLLCSTYGWNPIGLIIMCWVGCFVSYLTPLSTVCVPLLMEVGGYKQKDLLKAGWIPAVLTTITVVPWTLWLYPPI